MVENLNLVIDSLRAELRQLSDRNTAILKKTMMVRRTIEGLAEVFGPGVIDDELRYLLWPHRHVSRRVLGCLCRRLLGSRQRALQVGELLNLIDNEYPGTFKYVKQPDRYLRSVLEILVTLGEVAQERTESGVATWKAVSPGVEGNADGASSVLAEVSLSQQKINP